MPISNVFTKACSVGLLSTAVLGGCASNPIPGMGASDAQPRQERQERLDTQPVAAAQMGSVEEVVAPKVKGRNAEDFAAAVSAMKNNDFEQAERLLRKVTKSQPELAGPWVNLGQVYMSLGQEEEARMAFRKAIAANPANCAAYNQLGVLSRQMGDFKSAENHYLSCLSAKPDSADVYLNLGILYELYLGRLTEALSAYKQYQTLVTEPDRKVTGWVMDLERRTGR